MENCWCDCTREILKFPEAESGDPVPPGVSVLDGSLTGGGVAGLCGTFDFCLICPWLCPRLL